MTGRLRLAAALLAAVCGVRIVALLTYDPAGGTTALILLTAGLHLGLTVLAVSVEADRVITAARRAPLPGPRSELPTGVRHD